MPEIGARFTDASAAWLSKSASIDTRAAYARELQQFLRFVGIGRDHLEHLTTVRPHQVSGWRDYLRERGLSNAAIMRKLTVLRSLFSYLQVYGYTGANPAPSDFVEPDRDANPSMEVPPLLFGIARQLGRAFRFRCHR